MTQEMHRPSSLSLIITLSIEINSYCIIASRRPTIIRSKYQLESVKKEPCVVKDIAYNISYICCASPSPLPTPEKLLLWLTPVWKPWNFISLSSLLVFTIFRYKNWYHIITPLYSIYINLPGVNVTLPLTRTPVGMKGQWETLNVGVFSYFTKQNATMKLEFQCYFDASRNSAHKYIIAKSF